MRITIRSGGKTSAELQVGTPHRPHTGPLPQVGETIVLPEEGAGAPDAKGVLKVKKIVWHYTPDSAALWPEIICKPS